MRLEPDSYALPRVKLTRLLRMGSTGSLWAAFHEDLGKEVAIKVMSASLTDDPALVKRFNREGEFTRKIKSPHVPEVYDQGLTDDGVPYIVMELLRGENLADRLADRPRLSIEETCAIVLELCAALTEAHAVGVVHRDIKLSNVFIAEAGERATVKLLDFGLAKAHEPDMSVVTADGALVGTLVYMSPEQFQNAKEIDGRSDLWSVAVVAYRALTGRPPFRDDEGIGALLSDVRSGAFPTPSELRPDLSPELDAWFKKALTRDPGGRFQTAREMAEELKHAVRAAVSTTLKSPMLKPRSPSDAGVAQRAPSDAGAAARGLAEAGGALARPAEARPARSPRAFAVGALVVLAAIVAGWLAWRGL